MKIGDIIPATSAPSLVVPGHAHWIALTVRPQTEDVVEAWLDKRGVYAFHPVLERRRRQAGNVRSYYRRYLPGYVFARFPGVPVIHEVRRFRVITGAISHSDGGWAALDPASLRALHTMRRIDHEKQAARRAQREREQAARMPRAGESALFRAGPFAGQRCDVVELRADGGVVVRLRLFGSLLDAEARTHDLVGIPKAQSIDA